MTAALLPFLRCNNIINGERCPIEETARDAPAGRGPIRGAEDLRNALAWNGWTYTADGRDLCWYCSPRGTW